MVQQHQQQRRKLIIFWEGTANTLKPFTTQIGVFSKYCCAKALSSPSEVPNDLSDLKLSYVILRAIIVQQNTLVFFLADIVMSFLLFYVCSFDGCGVTNGTWGTLFASGLDGQVNLAIQIVKQMLQLQQPSKQGIHVVAVGLSRGAMACMKLAQKLAQQFTQSEVTSSMLLFDPVPGNAVSTGFPWTARWCQDLSSCHNLLRVLALYPYEALPDIAMHAPTLCWYNRETTLVQEDVCMGCHQGALFMPTLVPRNNYEEASTLSSRRIVDYLEYEGVKCDLPSFFYIPTPQTCIELCEQILRRPEPHTEALQRKTHDQTGQHRHILRHASTSKCQWLNRHHEQLVRAVQRQEEGGGLNAATLEAVFGETSRQTLKTTINRSYLLDVDDGYVMCGFS